MDSLNRRSLIKGAGAAAAVGSLPARGNALSQPSPELVRYRAALVAETDAQAKAIAAYDSWVATNAPEFGDYAGLEIAVTCGSQSRPEWSRAWATMERLGQDAVCKAFSDEWNEREGAACDLFAAIRDRRPASSQDLAEAVEAFRTMWGWPAGEPFSLGGEELGCGGDLAALFLAIDRLATGDAHG